MTDTFSFDNTLADDISKVRFEIGDTNSAGNYVWDQTITALVASEGSIGGAVVACIEYIITQLSDPDFKQDWLSVSNKEARLGFETLLKRKRQKYGIQTTTAVGKITATDLWREDSEQTDGDYNEND